MKSDKDTPPSSDELEVSIFGPGYGECIVVHYGLGNWLVIDSCIDPISRQPVALAYLNRLGVSTKQVHLVAATHWHDDHIRGLAHVTEACVEAQFCCSGALKTADFMQLAQLYSSAPIGMPSGPSEFNRIFSTISNRKGTLSYKPIKWSQNDQVLLRQSFSVHGAQYEALLISLSPSDEMVTRAARDLAQHWANVTDSHTVSRLVPNHPNHVSVAMSLSIGGRNILLGSDLEETGDSLTGWAAVCDSKTRVPQLAHTYKVAHHGSVSGFNPKIWGQMLANDPLSMITPFRRGFHKIPTPADQAQILALTKHAYLTADPQATKSPKKRAPKIEKLMSSVTVERRQSIDSVGHIRWRAPISDPFDSGIISLYDGAYQLTGPREPA
jgi:hypothetical protein